MGSEFKVDLDDIEQVIAKLGGLAGFIAEHLDEIDDQVAGLVGTGWESVAADAYQGAHQRWSLGARDFVDGIRDMSTAAKAAHSRYTNAIDINYRMLQGG
ncbi:WXG100 family type VII secretion target [Nocardia sp. NPDC058518]|uniref:WXG100 family type VII secretion target n=1 Tax=Nocardia sp. NPDC058518 TaxID=3346534 RepID=UPI0036584A30